MSDEEEEYDGYLSPEEYEFPDEKTLTPEQKTIKDELDDWINMKNKEKKELRVVNTRRFNKLLKHQKNVENFKELKKEQKGLRKPGNLKVPILITTPAKKGFHDEVEMIKIEHEVKKKKAQLIIDNQIEEYNSTYTKEFNEDNEEDRIFFVDALLKCLKLDPKRVQELVKDFEVKPTNSWIDQLKIDKRVRLRNIAIGQVFFKTIQDMYKRVSELFNRYIKFTNRLDTLDLDNYLKSETFFNDFDYIFPNEFDSNAAYTIVLDYVFEKTKYHNFIIKLNDLMYGIISAEIFDFYSIQNKEITKEEIIDKFLDVDDSTPKSIESVLNQLKDDGTISLIQPFKVYYLTPVYTRKGINEDGYIIEDDQERDISYIHVVEYWTPINYYFDEKQMVNADFIKAGVCNEYYKKVSNYVNKEGDIVYYERYFYDFYDLLKAHESTYREKGNEKRVQDIQQYFKNENNRIKNENNRIKLNNYIDYTIPPETTRRVDIPQMVKQALINYEEL